MQQRRPHKSHDDTSIPLGAQEPRSAASATTTIKNRRRRRQGQPKLRRGETITLLCSKRSLLFVLLSSFVLAFCYYWIINHSPFGNAIEEHVRQHLNLYDEIHRIAIEINATNTDFREAHSWPDYGQYKARPPTLLGPIYGPTVREVCDLTVLFLDPRLGDPHYGPGRSAWFALESIGAFAPKRPAATTCVTLLTSSCTMQAYLEEEAIDAGTTRVDSEEAVRDKVYASALPLFREMIHDGRVRLSFLDDVDKYQLKSCNDFGSLHFLMNVHFWKDKFTDLDSDSVLLIQDDSVLCHRRGGGQVVVGSFLDQYKDYAFVGGVWPRQADPLRPFPPEGMCAGMPARWKSWLLPQRRWEKWNAANAAGGQTKTTTANAPPKPKQMLQTNFPAICEDGHAPIGNGGFSLRSRSWLIRAIETCPHVKHSGLDTSASAGLACKVMDAIDEDFYFGVVLRGLGAPFPSAVEASLFAVEMIWPEQLGLSSNKYTSPADLNVTERLRLFDLFPTIRNKGPPTRSDKSSPPVLTVPYGVHKVWWYHPNELLLSSEMEESCPYLQYIFEPSMSRWHELHSEQRWAGIGS